MLLLGLRLRCLHVQFILHRKTFSPYGDSDEESDCSPPTPTNTKATEEKIDDSLRIFIEALPHLETIHYGFKYQASGRNGYCFCALATCLSPWRKKHHVNNDYSSCSPRRFHGLGLLQHCQDKGDDYHSATFYYLTNLFNTKSRSAQTALHHIYKRFNCRLYVCCMCTVNMGS
jgi:hypothetical protein